MSFLSLAPLQPALGLQKCGPADPSFVALMSFEDEVQPGVLQAVEALTEGSWGGRRGGRAQHEAKKHVVMLTGDNAQVAGQVAAQVGIGSFHAALKPEDKLAYINSFDTRTAAEVDRAGTSARPGLSGKQGGLLMMGDGINDAPALAAARVGVAVASSPSDMVAAAADIIVLNGHGVANLPWLFSVADRTRSVINQSLALALCSVVFATLPTVAGFFPLWLAVLLHEGATVLVALNSLRLLVDDGPAAAPAIGGGGLKEAVGSSLAALRDVFDADSDHPHPPGQADPGAGARGGGIPVTSRGCC